MQKWWKKENEAHEEVFAQLNSIIQNQQNQKDLDDRNFKLYSGLPISWAMINANSFDGFEPRLTMNVVQSAVNTLVSKVTKNRVKPTFLTDGANWGLQQEAKKLDKYVYGQFYKAKVYEETRKAFRDACIFGDGLVKIWHDSKGDINIKRVFKPCVYIDQGETLYGGDPLTVYEIRICDKETLKEKYPDYAAEIEQSSLKDIPDFISDIEAKIHLVAVVEAFRVTIDRETGKSVKGKHFIGISNRTFLFEDYKPTKIPYRKIPFVPNAIGYWSKGVSELITGHQVEINRMLKRISTSMNLMTSPNVLVDYMSDIIDTHFDNEVGNIIKFKNTPPIYNFPQGINPTVIEWFLMVYAKAFEEVGLSQLTAQSKKPEGLDSGKALREYSDIETERFAEIALNWEQFHLDISQEIIAHSEEIAKTGKSLVVLSPDKFGADKIDFKKIKLKDSEYIMQTYPTSLLPKTPAGRLAYVQEMMGAQLLTPEEGLSLLEFPDVAEITENKNAFIDNIRWTAYMMIEKAEYIPPEPYQNLDYGIQYMDATYMRMRMKNLDEDRLNLLQKWINDALSLKQQAMTPLEQPQTTESAGSELAQI